MSNLIRIGELASAIDLHENTIRRLAAQGTIPSLRSEGGQRLFRLDEVEAALKVRKAKKGSTSSQTKKSTWRKTLALPGLQEDKVWKEIREDLSLDMKAGAADIIPMAFNEMLNNAIEHSEGSNVDLTFSVTPEMWSFTIVDDGCGVFSKIQKGFGLSSPFESLGELSKGKQTTSPQAHSGEGIFFTSKAVDYFELTANGIAWVVDNIVEDFTATESKINRGTIVECRLNTNTDKKYEDVFKLFTDDFKFNRTEPVVKLFETGLSFLSRSEARRLMRGLEKFDLITLDFEKVGSVGQGFVDEIFRVWATDHPTTQITSINMAPAVAFMLRRATPKN